MYSTCIFCHHALGTNEVLEDFPVGRRMAFDSAKGRLWVVCGRCTRWNLSPLEERWEVTEHCERLFRGTTLRVSTDNIGLARVAEGTELVRVGSAQRPELAAWRYGDQFGRRRRRNWLACGATVAIGVPLLATGAYSALAAAIPGGAVLLQVPSWMQIYHARRGIIAKAELESGDKVIVRGKHLPAAKLLAPSRDHIGWGLRVEHDHGSVNVHGPDAIRISSKLLARVNRAGAGDKAVQRAVQRLEQEGGPTALFMGVAARPQKEPSSWVRYWPGMGARMDDHPPGTLRSLAIADRLALEMATHEESERRALEGELNALEAAWREAEEIASIADSLVPTWLEDRMKQYRTSDR